MKTLRRSLRAGVAALGFVAALGVESSSGASSMITAPAGATRGFIDVAALDFATLLPLPPALGSLAGKADLETVLQVQAWRTPEQVAWAKHVERDHVFDHANVLGWWFVGERLPLTAAFFRDLSIDIRAVDAAAKQPFLRPRPPKADPRVQPCVQVGNNTGYPSGSALQAFVWADLLADALPAKRDVLLARAERAAWGRLIGGVHYPSDLVAGRMLVEPFLAECRKSAEFRVRWEACAAEIRAAADEEKVE